MKQKFIAVAMTLMLLSSFLVAMPAQAAGSITETYTLDADFDLGVLDGVEYTTVHDQLQLSQEQTTLPFIWVANSGESTVSKIDTVTGKELGRYRTGPGTGFAENPSRTTVDANGDLWVGNRDSHTAVKIALNPTADTNGDGVFKTSQDLDDDGNITGAELLAWGEDDAVLMRIPVDSGPRALAVDALNNVWIGGTGGNMGYYEGQTGAQLKNIPIDKICYGALIDGNGTLWISNQYLGTLTRIDDPAGTHTITTITTGDGWVYGIGIDTSGYIYTSAWTNNRLRQRDPVAHVWNYSVPIFGGNAGRGVCVGLDGDVWVAQSGAEKVTRHNAANGDLIATVDVGNTPTGVATDAAGKIWVTNYGSSSVMRIDPATNSVDLTRAGHPYPYNYSDMTGIIARNITTKVGTWTVEYDSGAAGTAWDNVSWSDSVPAGTSVTVKVASSADGSTWSAWEDASNGGALGATPDGQYLRVEATLRILSGDVSPILYDLTIQGTPANEPPVADAGGPYVTTENSPIDFDGGASTDPDGDPLEYRWDFDSDGIYDTDWSPFFIATNMWCDDYSGTATLEVRDPAGLTDTDTATIEVTNLAPIIDELSADATEVQCKDQPITFTGIGKDPGCDTVIVAWDFGDGTTYIDETQVGPPFNSVVTHTYGEFGDYAVTLTVTDDDGGVATASIDVAVWDTTAPVLSGQCVESVNPHGNVIPGKERGKNGKDKPNVNPDGFYLLDFTVEDNCDPNPQLWVGTADNPFMFQVEPGITVKFTESVDAEPEMKKIGSPAQGGATAVTWHIILPADPVITAIDASGNYVTGCSCLVPPPPM